MWKEEFVEGGGEYVSAIAFRKLSLICSVEGGTRERIVGLTSRSDRINFVVAVFVVDSRFGVVLRTDRLLRFEVFCWYGVSKRDREGV